MFDNHNHTTCLKVANYKGDPDSSLPDRRFIFKTKSSDKAPFLIYVEDYNEQYFFIKFHPSRHNGNKKKYQLRIGCKTLPVRIISTCLNLVIDKMKKYPDCAFGVYGQWDETDVFRQSETSQRYRLWFKIAISKFDPEKFKFLYIDELNVFLVVPKHLYSEAYKAETIKYFNVRFKRRITELKVPTEEEFATYNYESRR